MGISFKRVVILIFSIPILGNTCKKGTICGDNNSYSFKANYVSVYPDFDSIHVGDTIWFNYNLPAFFIDTITNQRIDYSNAQNFGTFLSELKFTGGSISNPGSEYAVQNFKYILITGDSAENDFPTEGKAYNFIETNNSYILKVGIIADSLGTYGFALHDDAGVVRKGFECNKASFGFGFINTNQHLYLYQQNRPGYVISDYEAAHLYCFKVY